VTDPSPGLLREPQVRDKRLDVLGDAGDGRGVELAPLVQNALARRRASATAFGPGGALHPPTGSDRIGGGVLQEGASVIRARVGDPLYPNPSLV